MEKRKKRLQAGVGGLWGLWTGLFLIFIWIRDAAEVLYAIGMAATGLGALIILVLLLLMRYKNHEPIDLKVFNSGFMVGGVFLGLLLGYLIAMVREDVLLWSIVITFHVAGVLTIYTLKFALNYASGPFIERQDT